MAGKRNIAFSILVFIPLGALAGYFLILLTGQARFIDWNIFIQQLKSAELLNALKTSIFTATCAAAAAMVFAIPTGYALARYSFPGKQLLDSFLDLPIVLTPIALGTLILMMLNSRVGGALARLGITIPYTLAGVIVAQFTVVVAFPARMLKSVFESIPRRYEHVARILGCAAPAGFLKITLPLARRGIIAAFILSWARAIGEFGATVMVAGVAKGKTATLSSSIYQAMSVANLQLAVSLILILVVICFSLLVVLRIVSKGKG